MKIYLLFNIVLVIVKIKSVSGELCGCKTIRTCYKDMVERLKEKDEAACIEDASVATSTVEVFLKAIKAFCPNYITIIEENRTYEGRHLYEVILNVTIADKPEKKLPVIMIDAGQQADEESVGLALFVIEQLVACQENGEMLEQVKWVILPSTNPDGMMHAGNNRKSWKKNMKPSEDGLSIGVDISRNFPAQWESCKTQESGFSNDFPGLSASSENETIFIKKVMTHHKPNLKVYLSLRRDGHAILYPYSYSKAAVKNGNVIKIAGSIAAKVNSRAGGVQIFGNDTIFEANGKAQCGSSVDYAVDTVGAPLAYEMRVYIGSDNQIMSKFQQLPRGYDTTLRLGYFSGIRELYNEVTNTKNFNKMY